MRLINQATIGLIVMAAVPACSLETEDATNGTLNEDQQVIYDEASTETSTAVEAAKHCVSEALPAGSKKEPASPVCFGSFPEAIAYATDGWLQLSAEETTITQEQLDAAYSEAAANDVIIQATVIGISHEHKTFRGLSFIHTGGTGCDTDVGFEWEVSNIGSTWNDRISAAVGFDGCQGVYYEHANFDGASVETIWDGGAMSDETTSIRWR
jgi:hypothetical protein